jgi:hypothetical protein
MQGRRFVDVTEEGVLAEEASQFWIEVASKDRLSRIPVAPD